MNFDIRIKNSRSVHDDVSSFKEVFVGTTKIETDQFKYLGVLLGSKLMFVPELNASISNVSQKIYICCKKLGRFLTKKLHYSYSR